MEFELPFWAGRFPVSDGDDYPLSFHPLEMGDVALQTLFGYWQEGGPSECMLDEPPFDASKMPRSMFKRPRP
jgi:hypothetical protein